MPRANSTYRSVCQHGADPNTAILAALPHGDFEAVHALLRNGATLTLPVTAALGRIDHAECLLASASPEDRHRALALAAQFGHTEIVQLLLEAGEDPNRYNPEATHAHQAAFAGHFEVVPLLVHHGARLDLQDTLFHVTHQDGAIHAGYARVARYLSAPSSSPPASHKGKPR